MEEERGKEIEVVPILNPGMVEKIVHIWGQVQKLRFVLGIHAPYTVALVNGLCLVNVPNRVEMVHNRELENVLILNRRLVEETARVWDQIHIHVNVILTIVPYMAATHNGRLLAIAQGRVE